MKTWHIKALDVKSGKVVEVGDGSYSTQKEAEMAFNDINNEEEFRYSEPKYNCYSMIKDIKKFCKTPSQKKAFNKLVKAFASVDPKSLIDGELDHTVVEEFLGEFNDYDSLVSAAEEAGIDPSDTLNSRRFKEAKTKRGTLYLYFGTYVEDYDAYGVALIFTEKELQDAIKKVNNDAEIENKANKLVQPILKADPEVFLAALETILYESMDDTAHKSVDKEIKDILSRYLTLFEDYRRGWRGDNA